MARKSFRVQVELEIQSVTCPGVWLCPNGKVSLQVYMLDSCIQTAPLSPVFPLFIDERFVFYKTFATINRLFDLQRIFNREHLYAELIQWQDCEVGNVLSTFETSLTDLLFPSSCDVDLLMEPTRNYPGIIAPKIEICTKTTIDEVCAVDKCNSSSYVVNPKTISSQQCKDPCRRQQKKVCHSVPYHRQKVLCGQEKDKRMQPQFFSACKADDSLILRKPQGLGPSCSCDGKKKTRRKPPLKRFPQTKLKTSCRRSCDNDEFLKCLSSVPKRNHCKCVDGHEQPSCQICESYRRHFENLASPCPASESVDELRGKITTKNRSREEVFAKLKNDLEQDIDELMCMKRRKSKNLEGCNNNFGKCLSRQFCCKPRRCLCPKNMKKKVSTNSIWEKKNFVGKYSPKCTKAFKKLIPSIKPCKKSDCYTKRPETFCDAVSLRNSFVVDNMDCNREISKNASYESPLNLDFDDDECNALISKYFPQRKSCTKNNNDNNSLCSYFSSKIPSSIHDEKRSLGRNCTSSVPRFSSFCVLNLTNETTANNNPFNLKREDFFRNEISDSSPLELNSCKSMGQFDSLKSPRNSRSETCYILTSRSHPFQKQIETRSKSPCIEIDKDTAWCPYYGTPCSSNKLKDRIRSICSTDKVLDDLSRPKCTAAASYCGNDSDDCDNDNASSDSFDNKSIRKYFDERKKFTDSLNRFCDSLYHKIQYNYGKLCEDKCNNCCEY